MDAEEAFKKHQDSIMLRAKRAQLRIELAGYRHSGKPVEEWPQWQQQLKYVLDGVDELLATIKKEEMA